MSTWPEDAADRLDDVLVDVSAGEIPEYPAYTFVWCEDLATDEMVPLLATTRVGACNASCVIPVKRTAYEWDAAQAAQAHDRAVHQAFSDLIESEPHLEGQR